MIDLHTHSTASDGTLSPEDLVSLADELGLTAVALTDHDTVAGIEGAARAARGRRVTFIPGVEISAEIDNGSLHIIGLYLRHESPALLNALEWTIEARKERNLEMVKKLGALDMRVTIDEVAAVAGGEVVGRPHFAELLVKKKYAKNLEAAFKKYLSRGKAAYVPKKRLDRRRAVEAILSSGGVPILAHPDQTKLKGRHLERLIEELSGYGLLGIEAFYSGYSSSVSGQYTELAKKFGLARSGGSDFHGNIKPNIKLGTGLGKLYVPDELLEEIDKVRPR